MSCVSLIGMPGAGKTTIGQKLAQKLGWAFMDTDNAIEALYAAPLQKITDALGKEAFLNLECKVVCGIKASRCVIATGGSVVYRKRAMERLERMGPVIYVSAPIAALKERISKNPERGIAVAPGQTLEDLFEERKILYLQSAMLICQSHLNNPEDCAEILAGKLERLYGIGKSL